MGAAADLRRELNEIAAVDHHAHPLAAPDSGYRLVDLLTETEDPGLAASMRDHPSYPRAVRDLAAVLDVEADEGAIEECRKQLGSEAYTRRLLDACRFEEMLVDDGLRWRGILPLREHAKLVGIPVRRILRIEAVAEEAAAGWRAFDDIRARFRGLVTDALDAGAAGLKTIAAYRHGLDLPAPDLAVARRAYDKWASAGETRLAGPELVSFFLEEALEVLRDRPVPLQVHTGFGDTDLELHRANPSLLSPLFQNERNREIPFVLLHCYPYVREASFLASVYPNVFLDLSLALTFAAHRGPHLVLEALDMAPVSKLLFATDASRLPELFFLGAAWWRDSLTGALGRLVDDELIDARTALRWAELNLAGNARLLYRSLP